MDFFRIRRLEIPESKDDAREKTRLYELWPGSTDRAAKIQTSLEFIVAIHGLNGDLLTTWTQSERLWLRDFLPSAIPQARIFTYGYNAGLLFSGSVSRVDDFARFLLERLRSHRRDYEGMRRPVIFICHSLGGLVCKRAISLAYELRERYESLSKDIYGVIFMGTPHRGSNIASWSKVIRAFANIPLLGNLRTTLLKDLEPNSEMIQSISAEFIKRGKGLKKIFSFYEQQTIGGVLIVERNSAVIGLSNEICIPLDADHRSMCRFATDSSEAYLAVLDAIEELVNDSLSTIITHSTSRSITFRNNITNPSTMDAILNIPRPYEGTCDWFLSHENYQRWYHRSDDVGVLWIWGVAGIGKTVLMNFLVNHLRQNEPSSDIQHAVLCFFCDNKDPQRRTYSSIAQNLLAQILAKDLELLRYVDPWLVKKIAPGSIELFPFDASILAEDQIADMLWEAVVIILQRSSGICFWLVIDALDELDTRSRTKVLRQLVTVAHQDLGKRVYILLSDRVKSNLRDTSMTSIDHPLGADESWQDVDRYISETCEEFGEEHGLKSTDIRLMKQKLNLIARGNFLHATLAWANFNQDVSVWNSKTIRTRLEMVTSISKDTTSFYCSLLARVPRDMERYCKRAFAWVIGAQRPLTIHELKYAMVLSSKHESWRDIRKATHKLQNFHQYFEENFTYLLQRDASERVRLTHQTVKSLLLSSPGMSTDANELILQKFRLDTRTVEAEITRGCLVLLSLTDLGSHDFRSGVLSTIHTLVKHLKKTRSDRAENLLISAINHPETMLAGAKQYESMLRTWRTMSLFSYAVFWWEHHLKNLGSDKRVMRMMSRFVLSTQAHWCRRVTFRLRYRKPTWFDQVNIDDEFGRWEGVPPVYLALQLGDLPDVLYDLQDGGFDLNIRIPKIHGFTPLMVAILNDRAECVERLLKSKHIDIARTIPDALDRSCPTLLHLALHSSEDIWWILLRDPRMESALNMQDDGSRTPLQLLLQHHANDQKMSKNFYLHVAALNSLQIDRRDKDGLTYLHYCFRSRDYGEDLAIALINRPDFDITKLKETLPDISTDEPVGSGHLRSYAALAGEREWRRLEALILERDPEQVLYSYEDTMNLPELYAYWGNRKGLAWILDILPASIYRDFGPLHARLLHLCARQNWEDLANLAVDKFGLDIMETDENGRTILYYASFFGWMSIDKFCQGRSLEELNHTSNDGKTPLIVAVENQNENAVRNLRQAGARILVRDRRGRTAVHVAAEHGNFKIYGQLIDSSILDHGRDEEGRSLLHCLAMWAPKEMVLDYIKRFRPIIDLFDRKRHTPLIYAARHLNTGAAEALLQAGATPYFKDSSGSTAIHYALSEGLLNFVKILLKYNVPIDDLDAFGRSALHLALNSQNLDMIEFVVNSIISQQKEMDLPTAEQDLSFMLHYRDKFGQNVVHRACFVKNEDQRRTVGDEWTTDFEDLTLEQQSSLTSTDAVGQCLSILHSLGANINAVDKFLVTPLHIAVKNNHRPAVRALLSLKGIQVSPRDKLGWTPLDWSVAQSQIRITRLLEEHGAEHSREYLRSAERMAQVNEKYYDPELWAIDLSMRRNKYTLSEEQESALARLELEHMRLTGRELE